RFVLAARARDVAFVDGDGASLTSERGAITGDDVLYRVHARDGDGRVRVTATIDGAPRAFDLPTVKRRLPSAAVDEARAASDAGERDRAKEILRRAEDDERARGLLGRYELADGQLDAAAHDLDLAVTRDVGEGRASRAVADAMVLA